MNNELLVNEAEGVQYAGDKKTRLSFVKNSALHYVVSQVTSLVNVHSEVEVLAILKRIQHVYYEVMFNAREQLPLINHRAYATLRQYTCLVHFLDGEELLVTVSLH